MNPQREKVIARDWGEEEWEMNDLSGSEVVFEGDKSVLELGIGDGCTLYDKCPWVIYFNIVNLNLYEFPLNSEKI